MKVDWLGTSGPKNDTAVNSLGFLFASCVSDWVLENYNAEMSKDTDKSPKKSLPKEPRQEQLSKIGNLQTVTALPQ